MTSTAAMTPTSERERGSAIAENVMTMAFIVAVFLVVVQFAYAVHVRSTLTLAAAEGAREGARVNAPVGAATQRAHEFVVGSLGERYARSITSGVSNAHGVPVTTVTITAPVPVLGPFGIGINVSTTGRAVQEERA